MDENIKTIEVSGHKFEVDLRSAKKIETYKVGDRVKVLVKDYSGYQAHAGIIVGIDAFQKLPTIIIAYMDSVLGNDGSLRFAYMNSQTEDIEICPMSEDDIMPNREMATTCFDRAISTHEQEIDKIRTRKEYFLRHYGAVLGGSMEMKPAAEA